MGYKGQSLVYFSTCSTNSSYYDLPGTRLITFYNLCNGIPTNTLWGRHCHDPWSEFQRGLGASRDHIGTPLQYSCLENPMDGEVWRAAVHGVARSRTRLSNFPFTFMHWRRKWQPTPVFLPGESQGRRSLVGCRLWGHTELDITKRLSSSRDHIMH